MPDQFVVPQFLDVEAKILGPITGRQFVILLATAALEFIVYRLAGSIIWLLVIGVPLLAIGVTFAFARVNGQPFHYFVLNIVQTLRKPGLRVWDKILTAGELKKRLVKEKELPPKLPPTKAAISKSRLAEMSLVVNTGGTYRPEEEVFEYGKEQTKGSQA